MTVADLASTPAATLRRAFGPHQGSLLSELAWGRDGRRVVARPGERGVGCQETFGRDTDDPAVVRAELLLRDGRDDEARLALTAALAAAPNGPERRHIAARLRELT